ncbi:Protein TolB [compost metagenome]
MRAILKHGLGSLGICILMIVMGCSSSSNAAHPYASNEPIKTAKVFLPGVISTEKWEENLTFSQDGQTVYLNRVQFDPIQSNLYYSDFKDGQWGEPQKMSFSIDGRNDSWPFMSPDGKRLYFRSDRTTDKEPSFKRISRIWYVEREGDDWGKPQYTTLPNGNFSVAANHNAYVAVPNSTFTGEVIYLFKWKDGKYEKPEKLSSAINHPDYFNVSPYIAPDESFLIFSRYTREPETYVMYISYNRDGEWSEAEKLNESVNESGYFSTFGIVSPDRKYLIWSKGTSEDLDIYQMDLSESGIKLD